ncbi:Diacetylchitobiose uptake system permease protein NgcF [subsurface metagenome]|nr:ABC transporter permease subunit [Clostridia bacterium]
MGFYKMSKLLKKVRLTRNQQGFLFILPATLFLILVILVPAVTTLNYSFTNPRNGAFPTFVNYIRLLGDSSFFNALTNTLIFVFFSVSFHLLVGLSVALFLNSNLPARDRKFFRVIAILPWTVPDVIVGIVWRWIYNPIHGPLNDALYRVGISINTTINWLGSPDLAMISLIFANIWRGYAFVMLILLAGLQSIPKQLYEAASIDGASSFNSFRYITLPGLKKMIAIAAALDTIWEVRRFALVKTMTGGGPGNATEVLSTRIYKEYFQFFKFEYASAMAVALTVILFLISLPYIRTVLRKD